MKKFTTGLLNRTKSGSPGISRTNSGNHAFDLNNAHPDSLEANAARGVRLFCESGSMENGGEEVLHLPVIVDAAESSPAAAAAAAQQIRKFLTKEWAAKPYVQYNAIMLVRILSDNPGPSFTRNFDKSFVSTVKEVLRNCKDGSTQQILRETLDNLEANKQYQEGMEALVAMWRKEKGQQASFAGQQRRTMPVVPHWNQGYAMPQDRPHGPSRERSSRHHTLPPPQELASRIEEAKNSAKILMQLIQSTPGEELLENELIREFNERCQSAQRSMQGYINCDNPSPDDDTMLTLIETNEQLSLSSSRYQRALLTARRAFGVSPSPGFEGMVGQQEREQGQSGFAPPSGPPPLSAQQQQQYYPQSGNGMSAFASSATSPAAGEETYQPPAGPPPPRAPERQYNHSAFASSTTSPNDEMFLPPAGPPPPRKDVNTNYNHSAFASSSPTNGEPDFTPPPNPPPTLLNRLNSRGEETHPSPPSSPPKIQQPQAQSDPFADPAEYDANPPPLAFEPGHYGASSAVSPTEASDRERLPSQHQRSFGVEALPEEGTWDSTRSGSTFDSVGGGYRGAGSPTNVSRRPVSSVVGSEGAEYGGVGGGGAVSPERIRAAQGRRWPSQDEVSEIDGHSEVGRGGAGSPVVLGSGGRQ